MFAVVDWAEVNGLWHDTRAVCVATDGIYSCGEGVGTANDHLVALHHRAGINVGHAEALGCDPSRLTCILADGRACGWSADDLLCNIRAYYRPDLDSGTDAVNLPTLDGGNQSVSAAWAMNEDGIIVGESDRATPNSNPVACVWQFENGLWVAADLPEDASDAQTTALGISSAAMIVGVGRTAAGNPRPRAWELTGESEWTMIALPLLTGGARGEAHDVNDSGSIAGWSERDVSGTIAKHPVVWMKLGGAWIVIDLRPGSTEDFEARGIDGAGNVFGFRIPESSSVPHVALMWRPGQSGYEQIDLMCRLRDTDVGSEPDDATWDPYEILGVDESGWLAGWGKRTVDGVSSSPRAMIFQPLTCQADMNGDGWVGFPDLLIVLDLWDESQCQPADATEDGVFDFDDLLVVLSTWGCGDPVQAGEVPQCVADCLAKFPNDMDSAAKCIQAMLLAGTP